MTTPLPRILLVEDDAPLAYTIRMALEREGYRVIEAGDGKVGLDAALQERPDLVVLDVDLPRLDGFAVCRELRRVQFGAPILMLTGRAALDEKVFGLNVGADDYLTKPFELRELFARIHALVRRHERNRQKTQVLNFGAVRIDFGDKIVSREGRPVTLSKTEFALLELLAQNLGQPVSRTTILDVVWGYTRFPTTRTIDTHVWRLRQKLGDDGAKPRWLRRVHGRGYCLADPEKPDAENLE
ncbi:MAG TPA: response regulator transcription factor [Opitutaceae bacterium]|nr:response regulator transcription factor [Opitutaceae bacterium]